MIFLPRYEDYPDHLTPLYARVSDADANNLGVIFNDTFTEAVTIGLAGHTPDIGTSWTVDHGLIDVNATTDTAVAPGGQGSIFQRAAITDAVNDDQAVEAAFLDNGDFMGIIARYTSVSSAEDDWDGYLVTHKAANLTLFRRNGDLGGFTQLATAVLTFVSGEVVRIEITSFDIIVKVDDVSKLTHTDISVDKISSGGAGIRTFDIGGDQFDNFEVENI